MVVRDQQPDHAGTPAPGRRDRRGDRRTEPGSDSISSVPLRPSIRCRIATRPKPPLVGAVAAGRVEADAVVADVQGDLLLHVRQRHTDAGRLRVLRHVRERLLRRPEQSGLGLGRHHPWRAGRRQLYGDPVQSGPAPYDVGDRLTQGRRLQGLWTKGVDRAPRLGQTLPGQTDRGRDVPAPVGRVLGGLELGDDPGQALREGVVDLAGHPLPLVVHAGLARLGDELVVQDRVLGQGRLEAAVGLGQLVDRLLAFPAEHVTAPAEPGGQAHPDHVHSDDRGVREPAERVVLRVRRTPAPYRPRPRRRATPIRRDGQGSRTNV